MHALSRLLYFSHGKGSGHAMPDAAIIEATRKLYADFDVCFVSYGQGAETLAGLGEKVIDLRLPEWPPFLETEIRAGSVMRDQRPDLVISHGEFPVLPIAKLLGFPTLFIAHWFWRPTDLPMQCLQSADRILFLEEADVFEEPCHVAGKVHYFGPIVRHLGHTLADRDRLRAEMGLSSGSRLISVMPGAWDERRAPLADLLVAAFRALPFGEKRMIWLAGRDTDDLAQKFRSDSSVSFQSDIEGIGALMVASDLVVTKANCTITRELNSLGVPSLSVSYGLHPPNEILLERIATNVPLNVQNLNPDRLCAIMSDLLEEKIAPHGPDSQRTEERQPLREVAQYLANTIRELKPRYFR